MSKEPSNNRPPRIRGNKIINTKKAISYPADHAPDISDSHIENCDEGIIARDPVSKGKKRVKIFSIIVGVFTIVGVIYSILNTP